MKKITKLLLSGALAFSLCMPALSISASISADAAFSTTATGYDSADDVKYVTSGKYIYNWGAREEDCTFLSTYAQSFNSGSYSFETLSKNAGGTSQSNAPNSALYSALKSFMESKHTHKNAYSENNDLLQYTDCVSNNTTRISSFYSGTSLISDWDNREGSWNKEHTWPNSKGLGGSDENDVMMIRPTSVSENSNRGNTAYGQSSSYYDPNSLGANVRGDCARIFLYVYTRWGNTSYAWGTSGVMENLNVLLQWMEEDPVDTWEMGRNDAVQAITGTRNVFVDYPEYAWLLFGRAVPSNMVTPSGYAKSGTITGGTTTPDGGNGSGGTTTPDTPTTPTTQKEIVEAAQALSSGESLSGTYSLTGKVTEIKQADTSTNNVWLYMEVEGFSMQCYWLQNAADKVKVGDTITVSGTIKNYNGTIEFDKPSLVSVGENTDTPTTPDDNTGGNTGTDDTTPTQKEIIKAAQALSSGESLSGTYSLTGKVTEIKQADTSTNNVQLYMEVEGFSMYCYWLQNAADKVKVGDTITVSGTIKNYNGTIEFDKPSLVSIGENTPTTPDDNTGGNTGDNTDTPTTPDDNNTDQKTDDLYPEPSVNNGMNCNSSISGGLIGMTALLGLGAFLLKKKED